MTTYPFAGREIRHIGYGAMQLTGAGVFGPPKDRAEAIAVLREAVESGVNHIDTSDFYGPHITNQIIKEALYPYPQDLLIVTKISARRDEKGGWIPAMSPAELTEAVHSNLRNLGLDVLEVVNLRSMLGIHGPVEGSLAPQLETLAGLQEKGLVRHVGVSNVTPTQVKQAQGFFRIACVQNHYNIAHREDDSMIDSLAAQKIPYVPYFPLGGFNRLQSETLSAVAASLGATPMQVALAWLLHRSANILLIPGTSSRAHLRENLAAAGVALSAEAIARLNS